ncbi:hypothetical protein [Streptomyces sp. NPDC020298]|uniref:hypothetical protein n=1 Tax=unclassified Streptomyces TaxID=2593676 RepID=UPI0033D807C4
MSEPYRLAAEAAAQLRQFNHATVKTGEDWQNPADTYEALGELAYLTRILPQALEQAMRPVTVAQQRGQLTVADGEPVDRVTELRGSLDTVLAHARRLALAVDAMHTVTGTLTVRDADEPTAGGDVQ